MSWVLKMLMTFLFFNKSLYGINFNQKKKNLNLPLIHYKIEKTFQQKKKLKKKFLKFISHSLQDLEDISQKNILNIFLSFQYFSFLFLLQILEP